MPLHKCLSQYIWHFILPSVLCLFLSTRLNLLEDKDMVKIFFSNPVSVMEFLADNIQQFLKECMNK